VSKGWNTVGVSFVGYAKPFFKVLAECLPVTLGGRVMGWDTRVNDGAGSEIEE